MFVRDYILHLHSEIKTKDEVNNDVGARVSKSRAVSGDRRGDNCVAMLCLMEKMTKSAVVCSIFFLEGAIREVFQNAFEVVLDGTDDGANEYVPGFNGVTGASSGAKRYCSGGSGGASASRSKFHSEDESYDAEV